MFKGSIVALVTPMADGQVDEQAFQSLVEWHVEQGTNAVVPCGTTGESSTLSHAEHKRVIALCVEAASRRVPVIAGAGSNSTAEAVEMIKHAKQTGADATLVVTPYYNKPSQAGLTAHFKACAEAADLPLIIYNIPGRSVVDMSVATMKSLYEDHANIVGVKDATGDMTRPLKTRMALGSDFHQLSGEDATAVPFLAAGGVGCISVSANVEPRLCANMQKAWMDGDIATVQNLQFKLMPLHEAMFCDASPGPAKYALSRLGRCGSDTRPPLVPIGDAAKVRVDTALAGLGLV